MERQTALLQLQQEFPDMSQSVIGDVLGIYKGDPKAAAAALGGIEGETKREEEKKIQELRQLVPFASEELCREVLVSTHWDVEAAIVPVFTKGEEERNKARKEKESESIKKRQADSRRAYENLLDIFQTISKEDIQKLLDENEGDIEETTNQLLQIVQKQEEEKLKKKEATVVAEEKRMQEEQEFRLRELKIRALEEKFEDLSEKEVISALEANHWDIKKTHLVLLEISLDLKKKYLKSQFQSLKDEQIEAALEVNDWDKVKAAQFITEQLKEKRSSPVFVKKVSNDLLQKSVVVGQKLEEEIAASHVELERTLKEEGVAAFKKDLEHIMRVQARHGVSPGMAPPLPRQIDELLAKDRKPRPIDDNDDQPMIPQSLSEDATKVHEDKPHDNSPFAVTLVAPDSVDVGNPIVVEWEMTIGNSTNYDWIGLFPVDQPNKQYITYQWRGKNDTNKGTITFTAPNYYGTYECRYFVSNSYQHVAISNKIRVGPKVELQAELDQAKKAIVVKWNQVSGNKYSRAWIGLFEKSQTSNKQYLTWEYATSEATVSFPAPVKPTYYECRFFTTSYEDVARSNVVMIEGEDRVEASIANNIITVKPHIVSFDPYYDAVWVGVFFTSETDNRQWRRYKYVTDRDNEVQFKTPNTPGEYEVRLFAAKSYDLIVKSNSFQIEKK